MALIPPDAVTEFNLVLTDELKSEILTPSTVPVILIEPVIIWSPTKTLLPVVAKEAVFMFWIGKLYNPEPSPLNEPVKIDPVMSPVMLIEPVLTVFVVISSSTDGPREPDLAI